MEFKIIKVSD